MFSIDSIVEAKERAGLVFQNLMRMSVGVIYIIVTATIGTGQVESFLGKISGGFYIFSGFLLFILIRKKKNLNLLNYIGIFLDAFMVLVLAVLLHFVMGVETTPFSFVLKSDVYPITILFLLFHMISFQPAAVAVSGIILFLINTGLLLYSVYTGTLTDDIGDAFTSYRVNPDFEAGKLIMFALLAFTVWYISRRTRQTIEEAASAEVSRNRLGSYFSPSVLKTITEAERSNIESQSSLQKAAILFSDIEGFTTISENLSPKEVVSLLHDYHELMVKVIFKHNGTLDKFIGDAIMASFGTPLPSGNDVPNAVYAALEMEKELKDLNEKRISDGHFPIRHRIGIHYGEVLTGNIGTSERLEYTVIGDTVNTANRVEQACKKVKKSLLVSESVYEKTKSIFTYKKVGDARLKGKTNLIGLYEVYL